MASKKWPAGIPPWQLEPDPVCEMCGGEHGSELRTRRAHPTTEEEVALVRELGKEDTRTLCVACWLAVRIEAQVRWLFDANRDPYRLAGVGDVYLTISGLLFGARREDYAGDPDGAAEIEQSRAARVTALAIVAAGRWRLVHKGKSSKEWLLLKQRARDQGDPNTDRVKIDLCRQGVLSALEELEAGGPPSWRLNRQTSFGKLSDELVVRALRVIFNRAVRFARAALETGDVLGRRKYEDDGKTGLTPTDEHAGEAYEDQVEAEDHRQVLWDRLLAAATDSRQRELVKAKRDHKPLAVVARELGMTPTAARQAWLRIKRRAVKAAR